MQLLLTGGDKKQTIVMRVFTEYLISTSFESHSSCLSKPISIDAISSLVFHRCLLDEKTSDLEIISRDSGS